MRLSIDVPNPLNLRAVVFLDGVKAELCLMADEESGCIERYVPRTDPRWQTEFKYVDYWPTEVVRGAVKIVDPEAVDLGEVYLK